MNPNDEVQRERLFRAVSASYRALEPWRRINAALVEEYVGPGYGSRTRPRSSANKLINLTFQTVDAYMVELASNRPRVMVDTHHLALATFAKHFGVALNNLLQEIQIEKVLRQWVLDAFFCVGFVKVHLADSVEVEIENGLWMDPGTPFVSNVSLDNWVHDSTENRIDKVKFAGDMYRIPFDDLESDVFDQAVVKQLRPTSKYIGSDDDQDRLEQISRGDETDPDEFEPSIDLIDVWVPRDRKVYTFAVDSARKFTCKHKPLAVLDYIDGPEFGPYHKLGFADVPENIMPVSPAAHLYGLDKLANQLLGKQSRKARGQKDVFTYTPAGADSAKKVKAAEDQSWVEVQDASEINVLKIGGADQGAQALLVGVVQLYDRMAGNLQALLGLGPAADTASQEKVIQGRVSNRVASMQGQVAGATVGVIRDLARLLWQDEFKEIPGVVPIDGTDGMAMQSDWQPGDREGKFIDYNIGIDVYSMRYQTPAEKAETVTKMLMSVFVPMGQALTTQGGTINLEALTDMLADLMDLPQLREIVQFSTAYMGDGSEGPSAEAGKPPVTTRNYVRRSVPTGGTPDAKANVMQQMLMGQNVNPDQAASLSLG